jgi:transcription termination/antitermination protein NusA
VTVSRTHKNLLRRLFELEVPEIFKGAVELRSIAREPGYRSKVAVSSSQEGIDPVGACVGLRGIRIQNIVNELNGERIDVVQWDANSSRFVANALSPAQVVRVSVNEAENTASVVVPDRQLSLAIGKEGQNARLAAKLTGWRIDIRSESLAEQEGLAGAPPAAATEDKEAIAAEAPPATPAKRKRGAAAKEEPAVAERPLTPEEEAVLAIAEEEEVEVVEEPTAEEIVEETAVEAAPVVEPSKPQIRFAEELLATTTAPTGGKVKRGKGKKGVSKAVDEAEATIKPKKAKKTKARRPDIDEEMDDFIP